MVSFPGFLALLSVVGFIPSAIAGKYGPQSFTFANGAVPGTNNWNDGLVLESTFIESLGAPTASVLTNTLRLTRDGYTNTSVALKLPDLDIGQDISGFTAKFNLKLTASGTPGMGLALNVGDLPAGYGDGELGYSLEDGLVVGLDTYVDSETGETTGQFVIYTDRSRIASFPYPFVFDGVSRLLTVRHDSAGLDIIYGTAVIVENLAVPGYIRHVGDRFAITARTTEKATQDIFIDSLDVATTPTAFIQTGGVVITEFLADNADGFEDDYLNASDWIEIYNGGTTAMSMAGWYLTDDPTNKTKWPFPAFNLATNRYRLIWATGLDRRATNAELHANFSLEKSGGYLALISPTMTVASEFRYGAQQADVSYGEIGFARQLGYLETPTPTNKNISLVADGLPAEDVVFSREGGVIATSEPVLLSIAPPQAAGAEVRYTLNNTVPTIASPLYTSPFTITNTRNIRARVFAPGLLPGKVASRTFLKLDASLTQFAGTGKPFSSPLPVIVMDSFGVDVESGGTDASGGRPFRPIYAAVFDKDPVSGRVSLSAVPSFQSRGGAHMRGESSSGFGQKSYAWEIWDERNQDRDDSVLGLPAESDWILHGPWSDKTLMRNYLVYSTMNEARPDYLGSRTRFVEVIFNQRANQPVAYGDYRGVYLLVEKIKRNKNRVNIEKINPRVTDSNLVSGGYIFKTDKSSPGSTAWTTPRGVSIQSHDPEAFSAVQTRYLTAYLTNFEGALASASFADPVKGYAAWIDVSSFIDAQWWVEISKQVDGYVFSTYYHKDRGGKMRAGPLWDFNISLGNANYATGEVPTGWLYDESGTGALAGGLWYPSLHRDTEYRLRTFDRYWELRQGVWSTASLMARIEAVVAVMLDGNTNLIRNGMPESVQSPAARQYRKHQILGQAPWPNAAIESSLTTFQSTVNYMKNWITTRLNWIDDQVANGVYIFRPPVLNHPGGAVPSGFQLNLSPFSGTAPAGKAYVNGTVYYTTDGSDPRPANYPAPTSQDQVILEEYSPGSYFVPTAENGGSSVAFADWTGLELGPTASTLTWTGAKLGLGFDDAASPLYPHVGGGTAAQGDIREAMLGKSSTVFIRVPFTVNNDLLSRISSLKLRIRRDDAFIAYINGVEVARSNIRSNVVASYTNVANALPAQWRDSSAATAIDLVVGAGVPRLVAGENVLAILGINLSKTDDDALFSPKLTATLANIPATPITAQAYTEPLTLTSSTVIKARTFANGVWSPLTVATYVVGAEPASKSDLVISEIMYNPAAPTPTEALVSPNAADYEFLELLNTGAAAVDLSQVRFTNGVTFNFSGGDPTALVLPAGGRVVVCGNRAAFLARYGNRPEIRIAGTFVDNLSNGGERLTLVDKAGGIIADVRYQDSEPWPVDADGGGYSLVLVNPLSKPAPNYSLGTNWRSSAGWNGKPGETDTLPLSLSPQGDTDGDGQLNLLEYATGTDPSVPLVVKVIQASVRTVDVNGATATHIVVSYRLNLQSEGVRFDIEGSPDAVNWSSASNDWVYLSTQHNGDGTATVNLRSVLPAQQIGKRVSFLRLRVTQ
jgi:hypothetical protein